MGVSIKLITHINEVDHAEVPEDGSEKIVHLINVSGVARSCKEGWYGFEEEVDIWSGPCSIFNEHRSSLFLCFYDISYHDFIQTGLSLRPDSPFYFLFDHSDCEGDFSGRALRSTASDLSNHLDKVITECAGNEPFLRWYSDLERGFNKAVKTKGAIHLS